jgi:ferrous iron transport protein A
VLRLIPRRQASSSLPVLADTTTPAATAPVACALSACIAGSRATILEVRCGDAEACRLRALGLCEGASVDVVRSRDCTLLEVRGARLAIGAGIAAGITVLPVA